MTRQGARTGARARRLDYAEGRSGEAAGVGRRWYRCSSDLGARPVRRRTPRLVGHVIAETPGGAFANRRVPERPEWASSTIPTQPVHPHCYPCLARCPDKSPFLLATL